MKTRIKKIILLAAALLFLGTGVSFAHERYPAPPGNAYGHYKAKKHPVWQQKRPITKWHQPIKYEPRHVKEHHYDYDRYRGGVEGSVVKFFVADQNVAFKIVVKDRKY